MTIKLDALASWKLVPQGEQLLLQNEAEADRRIRIDLNCEDKTWVYVSSAAWPEKHPRFVAAVGPGLETVEFYAGGDLAVSFAPASPDGKPSQVWLYTAELEPNVVEVPDAVSFTEIHQRRARNPELELMQFWARQNERRMDEKLARMEALVTEKEAPANVDKRKVDPAAGANGAKPVGGDGQASSEAPAASVEPAGGAGGSGDES